MLIGVILASLAGFGRDRELKKLQQTSGSFLVGLIMVIVAGVTSAGIMLAFVYGQGPIQARMCILEAGRTVKLHVADKQALTKEYLVALDGTIALEGVGESPVAGFRRQGRVRQDCRSVLGLSQQPEGDATT